MRLVEYHRTEIIGFLCGIAAVLPLFGPIGPIPASIIALPFAAIAIAMFIFWHMRDKTASWGSRLILALTLAFTVLVFYASSQQQFAYLLQPGLWRDHSALYIQSKLFMFVVGLIGPAVAAMVASEATDKPRVLRGILASIVIVAVAAAFNTLISDGPKLIRTTYMEARVFFLHSPISPVAYGILFAFGAVASLYFRRGWIVCGFLLFMAALLSRRTETIVTVAAIITFATIMFWQTRNPKRSIVPGIGALVIAAALFAVGHSDHNMQYFSNMGHGLNQRVEMAEMAFAPVGSAATSPNLDAPNTFLDGSDILIEAAENAPTGLGGFALVDDLEKYPHNIILETLYEIGPLAAGLIIAIAGLPLLFGAVAVVRRRYNGLTIVFLGLLVAALVTSLKAGDLSSFGRLTFFATLAVAAISQASDPRESHQ